MFTQKDDPPLEIRIEAIMGGRGGAYLLASEKKNEMGNYPPRQGTSDRHGGAPLQV